MSLVYCDSGTVAKQAIHFAQAEPQFIKLNPGDILKSRDEWRQVYVVPNSAWKKCWRQIARYSVGKTVPDDERNEYRRSHNAHIMDVFQEFRNLDPGEIVREGDRFKDEAVTSDQIGKMVIHFQSEDFRRTIDRIPWNDKWRKLSLQETLQAGDEHWNPHTEQWDCIASTHQAHIGKLIAYTFFGTKGAIWTCCRRLKSTPTI